MKTTISDYKHLTTGKQAFHYTQSLAFNETGEAENESIHKGRTISYFLGVYLIIFSTILAAVLIEEYFFL